MIINGHFAILILGIFLITTTILLTKKYSWDIKEVTTFMAVSCVYIIFLTILLFPMPLFPEDGELGSINIIPFKTIIEYIRSAITEGRVQVAVYQIGGNILLFYLVTLATIQFTKCDRSRKFFIWLMFFSVIPECLQILISAIIGFLYRSIDIDDIILYFIGGLLAYYTNKKLKKNR